MPVIEHLQEEIETRMGQLYDTKREIAEAEPDRAPLAQATSAAEAAYEEEAARFQPIKDEYADVWKRYEAAKADLLAANRAQVEAAQDLAKHDRRIALMKERLASQSNAIPPIDEALERILKIHEANRVALARSAQIGTAKRGSSVPSRVPVEAGGFEDGDAVMDDARDLGTNASALGLRSRLDVGELLEGPPPSSFVVPGRPAVAKMVVDEREGPSGLSSSSRAEVDDLLDGGGKALSEDGRGSSAEPAAKRARTGET